MDKVSEPDIISSISELNRAGAAFLIADLRLSITMLDTAELFNTEKRARCFQNACNAYQTVVKFRKRLKLTPLERKTINTLLESLKTRLDAQARRL